MNMKVVLVDISSICSTQRLRIDHDRYIRNVAKIVASQGAVDKRPASFALFIRMFCCINQWLQWQYGTMSMLLCSCSSIRADKFA